MIDPSRADAVLGEVVARRFGAGADHRARRVVEALARAVREEHVALDLEDPEGPGRDELLELAEGHPRLIETLGYRDEVLPVGPPLVLTGGRHLHLRRHAGAEWRVAAAVAASREGPLGPPGTVGEPELAAALEEVGSALAARGLTSPELAVAARRALTHPLSIVTGGPGTGKTWLVGQILAVADAAARRAGSRPLSVAVAAPTGKAARRVAESLDEHLAASTHLLRDREREGSLHRLLGLRPERVGAPRPLGHDLVVVDEVSMADLELLDALVRAGEAGPQGPRLVLVGDPGQLASVEVGAVLADLCDPAARTEVIITRLGAVHRTGEGDLLDLAAAVRAGSLEEVTEVLGRGGATRRAASVSDPSAAREVFEGAERLGELAEAGDAAGALAAQRRLVVLCAARQGLGSVAWWNARVAHRHRQRWPLAPGERFSVGEPVLVTRTQRAWDVSNGDLGVVIERAGQRRVAFEGGRERPLAGLGALESAWALTIHKSQGSEFDEVVVSLPGEESALLSRELLYTAVTRARRRVSVLGSPATVSRALARRVSRVSGLAARLDAWS